MVKYSIFSAEVAREYVAESRNLVFPVGAEKGNIRCTIIHINRGSRIMFFRVSASVVSPSGAIIGGDIASTTDSITVKILDQCNSEFNLPIIIAIKTVFSFSLSQQSQDHHTTRPLAKSLKSHETSAEVYCATGEPTSAEIHSPTTTTHLVGSIFSSDANPSLD